MQPKKLLLITYHFPPSAASGAFRMLSFAKHLPSHGWRPIVVAPPSLPWEPVDADLTQQVPADVIVVPVAYPTAAPKVLRKFAQNALWLPRAWSACQRVIERYRPDAILTSGPPHCVHMLGHYLRRSSGLPWVADFRDPWISDGTPRDLSLLQHWLARWERTVFERADLILANAPNATRLFQQTYPARADRIATLTNGFDPRTVASGRPYQDAAVHLLHAGEIYAGRDPEPLFDAMMHLNRRADARPFHLDILGRCDGINGKNELMSFHGQQRYEQSLDAMAHADILVLFDSPGRTIGVPAKLYEYLGAGRPILALAEPDGDVAAILRSSGVVHRLARPKDATAIRQALLELECEFESPEASPPSSRLRQFTRANLASTLANHLDRLVRRPQVIATRVRQADALQEAAP